MKYTNTLKFAVVCGILFLNLVGYGQIAQTANADRIYQDSTDFTKSNFRFSSESELPKRLENCGDSFLEKITLLEYGAIYAADSKKVRLPGKCFFGRESEVLAFQKKLKIKSVVINGIRVELQSQALDALLEARNEALQAGFDISPRGSDASRRSFEDTVDLWNSRLIPALAYWQKKGKLTAEETQMLKSLPIDEQVAEIFRLEEKRIFFGTGFGKSIFHSVAPPGTSQHLALLAIDIEQFDNLKVRTILAKNGWFQTVKNDTPHFTFLGVSENNLPSRGLQKKVVGKQTYWIPKTTPIKTTTVKPTVSSRPTNNVTPKGNVFFPAVEGKYFTVSKGIFMTKATLGKLEKVAARYFELTGEKLHITSGFRTAERQAIAMYQMIKNYGIRYTYAQYVNDGAVREIINAKENENNYSAAITAMTKVIGNQMKKGIFLSDHLVEGAFDVRLKADFTILTKAVREFGGKTHREKDHYHVEF